MKIKAVRAYLKQIKLTKPYTIAYNTFSDVSMAFFEVELENGLIGYGTGSPAEDVVGESAAQSVANLNSPFIAALTGRDIRHFQQLIFETNVQFPHLPGTQAAVDLALHDAFAKWMGIPVVDYYGRKIDALPTSVTIGIKNVRDTLEEAKDYRALGFHILKVKMGIDPAEDIERILKLRESFGTAFRIRVDPNQGYTLLQLEQFIKATAAADIELIEQPLPVGKENDLLQLDSKLRKKIMGDESLKDAGAAIAFAHDHKPFGIYNIKLMKCGGIAGAMEIATIAKASGIDLFWGCNDESILSITAALHAAYSCPHTRYIDLDGSFDLAEDLVTGGFTVEQGYLKINNEPGFGTRMV
ncbi:MAG: hypothetical protein RL732_32 [Bacteroidota bacterium]